MLFSSPVFLFLFLPFSLLVYYITPKRYKNLLLLILSLGFYTWGEKQLVVLIILSAFTDYFAGLIIASGKKKAGLYLSICFNLGILAYFKYANFALTNINAVLEYFNLNVFYFKSVILPIGISFYTFQTMSYTIDVYRGHVKANRNFIDFATYVTLFPQLIAGPIVRYSEIETELKQRSISLNTFNQGIQRFIIGLAKKMIIANNCAIFADAAFSLTGSQSSALISWIGIIAYTLQIYFDFSGYSDMAIGLGKMFGFNFPENFNFPYISKSIREYWQRWHMTLSQWFKDYLYIPLGGNRLSNSRTYLNLFIVFLLTGLWHGASWNFIIWGIFHGLFIVLERFGLSKFLNKQVIFSHLYTLLVILFGFVIFRSENIDYAANYFKSLFNFSAKINYEFLAFYLTTEVCIALILGAIFSTKLLENLKTIIIKSNNIKTIKIAKLSYDIGLILLFVFCFYYIATDAYNPFIYFRF